MDIEIYTARHGLTESNKRKIYMGSSEEGLTQEGRQQAETLGKSLQALGIHRIYTSPLRRAIETSEIINQTFRVPIFLEGGLTEMRLGSWMGMTEDEVSKKFPEDYQIWNSRPSELILPDRETLVEVRIRVLNTIHKIRENNSGSSVLAVTHVAIIRSLIIYFKNLDINLYKTIDIPNLSVFRLQWDGESPNISRFL